MVGKMALSLSGHDKGQVYVIVREEGQFVYLCDGRLKTLARPKKKNIRHIQPIVRIPEEIRQCMYQNDALFDEGIKRAVTLYQKEH